MRSSQASLLSQAQQHFQQGKEENALNHLGMILRQDPGNSAANNLAARIFLKQKNIEYAQQAIEMAFESDAENKETLALNVDLLVEKQKLFEAYEAGVAYQKKHRSDNGFRYKLAVICTRIGKVDEAVHLLQTYISKKGSEAFAWLNLGHMYKAQSKMENAIEVYRQFIAKKPELDGVGYWHIADIKDAQFSAKDLNKLQLSIANTVGDTYNQSLLHFALGTHFDKNKAFDNAYQSFETANNLHKSLKPFNSNAFSKFIYSLEKFTNSQRFKFEVKETPIFIVGMPRSGSTLCERILSSHSEVVATDELSFINFMAAGLERTGNYADAVARLTREQCMSMRESYLADTQSYRTQKHRYFIDKNPTNFLHIPLIKKLFPEALIIHTFRDLMDNALSIYKRYFYFGHEYGYSFDDLDRYYQGYTRLMATWDKQFPGEIFHLNYEAMVSDSEQKIAAILNYCNLTHEQACFEFYKNKSAVLTPSVDQVSKPIYTKAVGSWKPYEKYIGVYEHKFAQHHTALAQLGKASSKAQCRESNEDREEDDTLKQAWSDYWTQGHITSFGDKYADNYQGSIKNYWRSVFNHLSKGKTILDIATGNGALLEMAKAEAPSSEIKLIGVDYAKIPQEVIKKRTGITIFSETPAESLPFENDTIDLVVSQYGAEYADFPNAMAEAHRVLKQQGELKLICHCAQSVVISDNQMIYQCSEALLAEGGAAEALQLLLAELDKNEQTAALDTEAAEKYRFSLNERLAIIHDRFGEVLFGTGFIDKMKTILSAGSGVNKLPLFTGYLRELERSQQRLEDLFSACISLTEQGQLEDVLSNAGLTLVSTNEIVEAGFGVVGLAIEAIKKS